MKIEDHIRNLRESLQVIEESIEKGLLDRQRNIGFNASAASADMIEIFLHKNNLIDPGFVVKHDWLASKNKIKEKFPFDFPNKQEILELASKIEEKRNTLCYGKPQRIELLQETINNLNKLKTILKLEGLDEN